MALFAVKHTNSLYIGGLQVLDETVPAENMPGWMRQRGEMEPLSDESTVSIISSETMCHDKYTDVHHDFLPRQCVETVRKGPYDFGAY